MSTSALVAWFGRRGIYYGWVIVAVMFLTLFLALGFRFAFGVFYSAILDESGWGRADTAGVVSASMIVYACTAALSERLSAQPRMTASQPNNDLGQPRRTSVNSSESFTISVVVMP